MDEQFFYFIRHTLPAVAPGICYGSTDLDLAAEFTQTLAGLKQVLPAGFAEVHSSPLQRCSRLAECLPARYHFYDPGWQELDFGDWEMCAWDKIPDAELQPWMADFVRVAPPSGESMLAMAERVRRCWNKLLQASKYPVAIVSHGGPIRVILADLLGLPLGQAFTLKVPYGAVIAANRLPNGHWQLRMLFPEVLTLG